MKIIDWEIKMTSKYQSRNGSGGTPVNLNTPTDLRFSPSWQLHIPQCRHQLHMNWVHGLSAGKTPGWSVDKNQVLTHLTLFESGWNWLSETDWLEIDWLKTVRMNTVKNQEIWNRNWLSMLDLKSTDCINISMLYQVVLFFFGCGYRRINFQPVRPVTSPNCPTLNLEYGFRHDVPDHTPCHTKATAASSRGDTCWSSTYKTRMWLAAKCFTLQLLRLEMTWNCLQLHLKRLSPFKCFSLGDSDHPVRLAHPPPLTNIEFTSFKALMIYLIHSCLKWWAGSRN